MNFSTFFNEASIKAIFFDMDGTLYDSMPIHAETITLAFRSLGISYDPIESYINEGVPTTKIINQVFLLNLGREGTVEEHNKMRNFIVKHQSKITHMPKVNGIDEVLSLCKNNNIDLFLVTGSPRESRFLQNIPIDFPQTFSPERIITGDDTPQGKPYPDPYLRALEISGYKSNEVAVVENAPLGVTSGKNAGIYTIAINTGILKSEDLSHADVLFNNMQDLQIHIEQIINTNNKNYLRC